ncbi:MAG: 4-hydroxy-3-methylbut-2-enyl diphosphate reductase [Gammaproteobacteria bacterium]
MEIVLANPRGFCAGVVRAVQMVERLLETQGAPIYVRHQLVHNRQVVANLEARGVVFVEQVHEVPPGMPLVFSAHGVGQDVYKQADQGAYSYYDATCPLVLKVHGEVQRYSKQGLEGILIGHAGHPEVEGTLGQLASSVGTQSPAKMHLVQNQEEAWQLQVQNPEQLFLVTQTTLSIDDTNEIRTILHQRFPALVAPAKQDICYATQNRQDAVKQLALEVDMVLVVGSSNSSNSNRLCELARLCGVQAKLVDAPEQLDMRWFAEVDRLGITAGASTPESLVSQIIQRLEQNGAQIVGQVGKNQETEFFALPKSLRA